MKISELIVKLAEMMREHGDLPVHLEDQSTFEGDCGYPVNSLAVAETHPEEFPKRVVLHDGIPLL